MLMRIEVPLEVDWAMVKSLCDEGWPRRYEEGVKRSVVSVVDETGLGETGPVDLGHDRVTISIHEVNRVRASYLWKTSNDNFIDHMITERITRAVDAYFRAIGVGGVKGCPPTWARFGPSSPDTTFHGEGYGACSECGKKVCFEAHTQDDPPEYEVCAGCSRNTCPDCTTYEGEEPFCPSCAAEPTDSGSDPQLSCEVAPKIPLGDLDEGEKAVGYIIDDLRSWVEDYRAGNPPRQYHIDHICERLGDLIAAWDAKDEL